MPGPVTKIAPAVLLVVGGVALAVVLAWALGWRESDRGADHPPGQDSTIQRVAGEAPAPAPLALHAPSVGDTVAKEDVSPDPFLEAMKRALSGEEGPPPATGSRLTESQIADLIAVLLDSDGSLQERRSAAWALARAGDPTALSALQDAMPDSPPYLKAAIAEALGHCPNPAAKDILIAIMASELNETALRGAVRGVAAIGGQEGVEILSEIIQANERAPSVRAEAAERLGTIAVPEALTALLESYDTLGDPNEGLTESILAGIGSRDLGETREFFQGVLDSPDNGQKLRVAAVEALEDASGEVGPFLLKYVTDSDPEVRGAAAWSLAVADEPGDLSEELVNSLSSERNAEVRKRIYQALENQELVDTEAVLSHALGERDLEARLAASGLLAQNLPRFGESAVREEFDTVIVPELLDAALNQQDTNARLGAVITLRKARTPAAFDALAEIANQSLDPRIAQAAERGLPK